MLLSRNPNSTYCIAAKLNLSEKVDDGRIDPDMPNLFYETGSIAQLKGVAEFATKPPNPKSLNTNNNDENKNNSESDEMYPSGDTEDDWRKFFEEVQKVLPCASLTPHAHTSVSFLSALALGRPHTNPVTSPMPRLSVGAEEETRQALATGTLPHLTQPFLVMDWVSPCVDMGGIAHGSSVLWSCCHLPTALLASFIKHLARLSLSSPPAAVDMVIPFTYYMLKRHPALMYIIHKVDINGVNDRLIDTEPDPMNTQAIHSSLCELLSHSTLHHLFETKINHTKGMDISPRGVDGVKADAEEGGEESGEKEESGESGDESAEESGYEVKVRMGKMRRRKKKRTKMNVGVPERHRDVIGELLGFWVVRCK
ncbi:hypothetical protein BJ165DRAFT_1400829 [Panaeolus papilionaceus]|nr:hypothetical protein BJ165DRAFT_1400829 [Panaeolus papilionaceus]